MFLEDKNASEKDVCSMKVNVKTVISRSTQALSTALITARPQCPNASS